MEMTGRIAIVCNGSVPGSRLPSGAQGLRAYGLYLGLVSAGRSCDVVTRASTVKAQLDRWSARSMRFPRYWRVMQDGMLETHLKSEYDAVVFVGWVGIDEFRNEGGQKVVYDFFSPSMVEHSFISSGKRLDAKRLKKENLIAQASHVIANGAGRAEYGVDYMQANASLSHLPTPLSVRLSLPWAKFSSPSDGPLQVFFGGFDQAWTKGLGAKALEELAALDGIKVTAIGVGEHLHFQDHRTGAVPNMGSRVNYHDVAELERYRAINGACHVSLDVFERNAERELCYSTRAVTSLCSGCPVITMAFTEVGRLVAETGAGWTLEAFSLPALKDLLQHLARNRDEVEACAQRTRIFWDRYCNPETEIRPLLEIL